MSAPGPLGRGGGGAVAPPGPPPGCGLFTVAVPWLSISEVTAVRSLGTRKSSRCHRSIHPSSIRPSSKSSGPCGCVPAPPRCDFHATLVHKDSAVM